MKWAEVKVGMTLRRVYRPDERRGRPGEEFGFVLAKTNSQLQVRDGRGTVSWIVDGRWLVETGVLTQLVEK